MCVHGFFLVPKAWLVNPIPGDTSYRNTYRTFATMSEGHRVIYTIDVKTFDTHVCSHLCCLIRHLFVDIVRLRIADFNGSPFEVCDISIILHIILCTWLFPVSDPK